MVRQVGRVIVLKGGGWCYFRDLTLEQKTAFYPVVVAQREARFAELRAEGKSEEYLEKLWPLPPFEEWVSEP